MSARSLLCIVSFWTVMFLGPAPVVLTLFDGWALGVALADDDDDGGDDDDDDNDDDDNSRASARSDRDSSDPQIRRAQPRNTSARRQPAAPVQPLPQFAPEIVVSDLSEADLALLVAEGFALIERRSIATLALTLDRLSAPAGLSLEAARDRIRLLPTGTDADFNHFYRTSQAEPVAMAAPVCSHENCPAFAAVNWPLAAIEAGQCPVTSPIGLIDTGINPDHDILEDAALDLLPRPGSDTASGAVHGTAVASLLLGKAGSRVPGLLQGAQVLAVDVFTRVAGDERADVVSLVEGLDLLAAREVRLFNLSLAGPQNTVLTRMIDRLTDPAALDAVIVAAAGNGGPAAEPAWPAAHPRVVAVTAIDARGRVYGRAQRGEHVSLAAPGVNLLAATSIRGARAKTGTSFAVPFVTAAAALLLSRADLTASDVRATLAATARDLGAAGRDPVYGYGLLSAQDFCG